MNQYHLKNLIIPYHHHFVNIANNCERIIFRSSLSNQSQGEVIRKDAIELLGNLMGQTVPRTDNNVPQSYPEIKTEINFIPQESDVYKIPVNIDESRTWLEWTQYWFEYTWQKFGGIISLLAPPIGATILIIWRKISQTTRAKEIDKNKSQTGSPLP